MDILFRSKKLETLCHDLSFATGALGAPCARKLVARLADLDAAQHLAIAPSLPGRFHALKADRAGQYAFHLAGGVRLVIAPAKNPVPRLPDGSVNLVEVAAICVVFIGNYHD
ncbi:MAG: type II toxin-antitoxin system RelE/ParE family toxin [Candidatus Dormibacteraceae bacterium]